MRARVPACGARACACACLHARERSILYRGAAAGPLRRCPWSRQFLACSAACYAEAEAAHRARLALCFCSAEVGERPAWDECEPLVWLEHASASDAQWDSLRDATPQAELKPRGAPRPRAHGSVVARKAKPS